MPDPTVKQIVLDLVAFGPQPENRWRHRIVEGEIVRLGRAPRHGLRVAWDMMISREHAELTVTSDELHVKCLETARNPLVSQKKPHRELTLGNGESFQIGTTTFTVEVTRPLPARSSENTLDSMEIVEEYTFSPVSMQSVKFGNADLRLEVLSKLPRVFAESRDEKTLANRLVALLLEGLPRARAAAVLKFQDAHRVDNPEVNYWDVRGGDARHFHPSRRLMQATLSQGDSRLHILSESASSRNAVTMQENLDWAFCTPLLVAENEAWCLYASGQVFAPDLLTMEQDLRGDVRFTELLAQFLSSFRQVCRLQRQQVALSQFFSPAVMETLIGGQAAVLLTPRESDITVLFCDVRGFSRAAEESPHALGELLERISRALSVMTRGIVRYDGVIADFQGDAALGFWGWPVAMEDGPLPACRAALYIDSIFRAAALDQQHALVDFRVGIGIAHGRAIAGTSGPWSNQRSERSAR